MEKYTDNYYMYSNKEDTRDAFEEAVPNATRNAAERASYAAYEVMFTGYWTMQGEFYATHVNDIALEESVKL